MKFEYVILVTSNHYPNIPVDFPCGMARAIKAAIEAKKFYEGANVDEGDNKVVIKRKLY